TNSFVLHNELYRLSSGHPFQIIFLQLNVSAISSIAPFLSPMGNSTCADETASPASFKYFPACLTEMLSGQNAVSTASNPIPAILCNVSAILSLIWLLTVYNCNPT